MDYIAVKFDYQESDGRREMGRVIVKRPGLCTTIQDRGRVGYQSYGIPPSGVMDRYSYLFANRLLNNSDDEAVLEATLSGPELEFESDTAIAITGGDLSPKLNGRSIAMWRTIEVNQGDILSFEGNRSGSRAYIAFLDGIDTLEVMGSRSTYTRGNIGRSLKMGDRIELKTTARDIDTVTGRFVSPKYIPEYRKNIELRVIMGPQSYKFTDRGIETFLNSEFICSKENDRMGYRLRGARVETVDGSDIISDGVALGAIQITNEGDPIIMMTDRQTVGGYAKIACVISRDIPLLAQAKVGDRITFKKVTIYEARELLFNWGVNKDVC